MMLRQNKQRKSEQVFEGVVIENGGTYWGCQYKDGQIEEIDYGPLENATIYDPKYCKTPLYASRGYKPRDRKMLELGRFMKVKKTISIEVEEQ